MFIINCTAIAGQDRVMIPGDPERELHQQREKEGIPLLDVVLKDLEEVGKQFGLKL